MCRVRLFVNPRKIVDYIQPQAGKNKFIPSYVVETCRRVEEHIRRAKEIVDFLHLKKDDEGREVTKVIDCITKWCYIPKRLTGKELVDYLSMIGILVMNCPHNVPYNDLPVHNPRLQLTTIMPSQSKRKRVWDGVEEENKKRQVC